MKDLINFQEKIISLHSRWSRKNLLRYFMPKGSPPKIIGNILVFAQREILAWGVASTYPLLAPEAPTLKTPLALPALYLYLSA